MLVAIFDWPSLSPCSLVPSSDVNLHSASVDLRNRMLAVSNLVLIGVMYIIALEQVNQPLLRNKEEISSGGLVQGFNGGHSPEVAGNGRCRAHRATIPTRSPAAAAERVLAVLGGTLLRSRSQWFNHFTFTGNIDSSCT